MNASIFSLEGWRKKEKGARFSERNKCTKFDLLLSKQRVCGCRKQNWRELRAILRDLIRFYAGFLGFFLGFMQVFAKEFPFLREGGSVH